MLYCLFFWFVCFLLVFVLVLEISCSNFLKAGRSFHISNCNWFSDEQWMVLQLHISNVWRNCMIRSGSRYSLQTSLFSHIHQFHFHFLRLLLKTLVRSFRAFEILNKIICYYKMLFMVLGYYYSKQVLCVI